MLGKRIRSLLRAGLLLAFVVAGQGSALAQTSVVLPNIITPGIVVPGIAIPVGGTPIVTLPSLTLPGVNVLNTAGLPASLNLPVNADVLLVNLPGVSILAPGLAQLSVFGNGVLGLVLNQVGQGDQLLTGVLGTNLLTPVDQLLNSLLSGDPGSSWSPTAAFGPERTGCPARLR